MNKTIYNPETIVSIDLFVNRVNTSYTWKSEKKLFGFIFRKEGIYRYNWGKSDEYVGDKVSDDCFIKGKHVFLKPYIKIHFANGDSDKKTFNTPEEANDFLKQYPKFINL